MDKTCQTCGRWFEAGWHTRKRCCDECRRHTGQYKAQPTKAKAGEE